MSPQSNTPTPEDELNDYERSLEGRYDTLWFDYKRQIDDLHREWIRSHREAGYVYFAEMKIRDEVRYDGDPYRVKVGIARKPAARFAQLNRFSVVMPMRIVPSFIFFSPDARSLESRLHWSLNRYRSNGEWFMLPRAVLIVFSEVWYTTGTGEDLRFIDYDGSHFTLADMLDQCRRTDEMLSSAPDVQP